MKIYKYTATRYIKAENKELADEFFAHDSELFAGEAVCEEVPKEEYENLDVINIKH